ncbi:DNA translocase FtsK [Snodgrassella communis]|uniref:DNA translocase FtsK n=1 Tax=Snodgrassella communis TaxID=2946699 RepID=UPI00286ABEE6|nr:DNA translocase FtsK [Snodgrassella communis]WMY90925.1 DNA translocase FtsK [Snodgrassella communis]
MWWIVLILLIIAICALFWWRNIQERKWQLEITYLSRYENRLQPGQITAPQAKKVSLVKRIVSNLMLRRGLLYHQSAPASLQKQQSPATESVQTEPISEPPPVPVFTYANEQPQHKSQPAEINQPQLPPQQSVPKQITVTEASPKPAKNKAASELTEAFANNASTGHQLTVLESRQQLAEKSLTAMPIQAVGSNDTQLETEQKTEHYSSLDGAADADDEALQEENILITSEETVNQAVELTPNKDLEVITLAEATRKVATHPLADAVAESAPVLEVIQVNWQHKPVSRQNQQSQRYAKEITADDPIINKVRSRTKAEQAALLRARALKNFDLNDLQQATQRKLGNSVGAPSHLAYPLSPLSNSDYHEQHSYRHQHDGVQIIDEEDIRLNLLRQRLARQRHHDTSDHINSGYSVQVIAEDEVYANLAKTDSPVNKRRFQRPVVRESVIPAAARISKRHAVKMMAPVADMSVETSHAGAAGRERAPLSTRFTPFQPMPVAITATPFVTVPPADDFTSADTDYDNPIGLDAVPMDGSITETMRSGRNQIHYTPEIQPVAQTVSVNSSATNSYYDETAHSILGNDGAVSTIQDGNVGDVAVATAPVEDPYFADTDEEANLSAYFPKMDKPEGKETDIDVSKYWPQREIQSANDSATLPEADELMTKEFSATQTESVPLVKSVNEVIHLNPPQPPAEQKKNSSVQVQQTAIGMALQKALHQTEGAKSVTRPQLKLQLPSMDLLLPPHYDPAAQQSEEALLENGITIEEKLAEFKVKVRVIDAFAGPVITRYEIEPAQGVRGNQVVNLEKDLARSLGFAAIRVVETIPGKTCMGLELPNPKRQIIRLSEIFSAPVFQQSRSKLTLALGQGITGQPVVTDLAKAPHLLVAGTTGSGKSVGVNAMILSMLFKARPDEVRLIMIDPKMLELSIYEGIPHLLAPVVTDMKLAANALTWCVNEMEKRYRLMSHAGVRNLAGFNQKIEELAAQNKKLFNPFSLSSSDPEPLEKLPYIVVVVDEFADLMMTAGKKIEELIARLAQKARAAGIHLILATQRPSVDVITGLIKANIPTRIAFQVSSKVDSRTILDQMGAENLLGQGDMLFLPPGTAYPERVHGAFVADEEVHRVVHYLKQFGEPKYINDILTAGVSDDDMASNASTRSNEDELDPLYDEAVALVVKTRKASISSVQRQLRIGYNRAARLVEQMEVEGIVSAAEGNGNRTVLTPKTNHLDD